jgi:hypothetical protein
MTSHYTSQVSPFGHPRVIACLAAHRGFSQLATPFVACLRQGILHMLLVAYPPLHSCRATTCIYPMLISIFKERPFFSSLPFLIDRIFGGRRGDFLSHGADRDRTDGLRLAKAALSQLSYSPELAFPSRLFMLRWA